MYKGLSDRGFFHKDEAETMAEFGAGGVDLKYRGDGSQPGAPRVSMNHIELVNLFKAALKTGAVKPEELDLKGGCKCSKY